MIWPSVTAMTAITAMAVMAVTTRPKRSRIGYGYSGYSGVRYDVTLGGGVVGGVVVVPGCSCSKL